MYNSNEQISLFFHFYLSQQSIPLSIKRTTTFRLFSSKEKENIDWSKKKKKRVLDSITIVHRLPSPRRLNSRLFSIKTGKCFFIRSIRKIRKRRFFESSASVYPTRCGAPSDNTVDSIENKKPLTASPYDVLKTRSNDSARFPGVTWFLEGCQSRLYSRVSGLVCRSSKRQPVRAVNFCAGTHLDMHIHERWIQKGKTSSISIKHPNRFENDEGSNTNVCKVYASIETFSFYVLWFRSQRMSREFLRVFGGDCSPFFCE